MQLDLADQRGNAWLAGVEGQKKSSGSGPQVLLIWASSL